MFILRLKYLFFKVIKIKARIKFIKLLFSIRILNEYCFNTAFLLIRFN